MHIWDFLPAHRLAGLIDASIIHGGEGTVQTACQYGVPFAGIGLQLEQTWNIEDCVRYGNALRIRGRDIGRRRLGSIVLRPLEDPTLKERALRLAQAAASIDGPERSAEEIEKVLAQV